ncbi:hypothetical protein Tco_0386620 [Tanacetum coccineum]
MDSNLNNKNDQWELSLDIDDFDPRLTPVLRPSSSTRVETSPSTQNLVRIISGLAGIVQASKLLKQMDILVGLDGVVMSTQEYMKKVVEDVGEDFKRGSWVSATDYVNANGGTDITIEDVLILANVSVFSLKPSMHHLNITMRNMVKVFRKDTVPGIGSG